MCIAGIVLNVHPNMPLLVIHNRDEDEFRSRNFTSSMREDPISRIICACDQTPLDARTLKYVSNLLDLKGLQSKTPYIFNRTWFGLQAIEDCRDDTQKEILRLSFLTNIRGQKPRSLSRGVLIPYCLKHNKQDPLLSLLLHKASAVNLFFGRVLRSHVSSESTVELQYSTNHPQCLFKRPKKLTNGIHVVSNSVLDDFSWPKVSYLRQRIEETILPLMTSDAPHHILEDILGKSADLLCETPHFAAEVIGTRTPPVECQKQQGLYVRSTSRRSRSSKRPSFIQNAEIELRDDQHWAIRYGQIKGECFQTTTQTILCIHKSTNPSSDMDMEFTLLSRDTFDSASHRDWRRFRGSLPSMNL